MNFARYVVVLTDLSLFFYFRYSNKLVAAVFITLAVFAIVGLATMKNEYRECTGIIIRRVLFLRYPFPCCRRLWFIPLTQHSHHFLLRIVTFEKLKHLGLEQFPVEFPVTLHRLHGYGYFFGKFLLNGALTQSSEQSNLY